MNVRTASSSDRIAQLKKIGPVRVWSLLVTVFGDLTHETDASLTSAQLNRLFEAMQIRPEALRVALHRLRKDGWILSERMGRLSSYSMTANGRAETAAARDRVYQAFSTKRRAWVLGLAPNALPEDALRIGPGVGLFRPDQMSAGDDIWSFHVGEEVPPDWVLETILPAEFLDLADRLASFLEGRATFQSADGPDRKMAERTLILHHWRRLALRDGTWLTMELASDGRVAECARAVRDALKDIPIQQIDGA
ncbi:MAG: hypothetical protein AAGG57_08965 [Pseudomonadota bacterium]